MPGAQGLRRRQGAAGPGFLDGRGGSRRPVPTRADSMTPRELATEEAKAGLTTRGCQAAARASSPSSARIWQACRDDLAGFGQGGALAVLAVLHLGVVAVVGGGGAGVGLARLIHRPAQHRRPPPGPPPRPAPAVPRPTREVQPAE